MVQLLLSKRANPNIADGVHGWSALHHAAFLGREDIIEKLLKAGAQVNFRDNRVGDLSSP